MSPRQTICRTSCAFTHHARPWWLKHEAHLTRSISECFRAADIEPVKNGLRHSFCTLPRIASTQNVAQVALEAGNSPTILFQHYRELATKKQASDWFAVRPTGQPKNVIPVRKAA